MVHGPGDAAKWPSVPAPVLSSVAQSALGATPDGSEKLPWQLGAELDPFVILCFMFPIKSQNILDYVGLVFPLSLSHFFAIGSFPASARALLHQSELGSHDLCMCRFAEPLLKCHQVMQNRGPYGQFFELRYYYGQSWPTDFHPESHTIFFFSLSLSLSLSLPPLPNVG